MIRTDSRKVQKGDTFVALPGISSNGDQYIAKALEAGAGTIVCRKPENGQPAVTKGSGSSDVTWIYTDHPRRYLEQLLVQEYGAVIGQMTLIALTGTNGKTTTCYLIAQALNRLGRRCAYIGTIGFFLGEKVCDLPNTSVDICDLYELLLKAHEAGYDTVALEASSQGIDMGRLNTLEFDTAVFTNLTEDHLDYHKTMERYALAKQQLFRHIRPGGTALVNADDPYRRYFILDGNTTRTYGIETGDVRAVSYRMQDGTDLCFTLDGDDTGRSNLKEKSDGTENCREYRVHTALAGRYNVYNTLAVIGTLRILGYSPEEICCGLEDLQAPAGRCDRIPCNGASIVIDYAHTPDAVEKIMETAREFTTGKMYIVFGCTGDREREKRPVMTQLVLQGCDYAIITNDDVHSEPEQQIVDDMLKGNTCENFEICLDRREAIRRGMDLLDPGDSLLILGKGHEEYIIMDGYRIPHNDRKAVLELMNR